LRRGPVDVETFRRPAEIHPGHRDVTGGWLRAGVFGAMDGLVSNFALIAGVVGGGGSARTVVITGIAGLVAGSCSMASGEYTSVASQTEAAQAEIAVERRELEQNPEQEKKELAMLFEARGVSPALAHQVAQELSANPDVVWRIHVREELGIDPDDLPSPWVAAISSFLTFAVGAFLPIIPFLLGATSLLPALLISCLGLSAAGALVTRLTVRSGWYGGTRQLLLGALSAAVTFGVGHLLGVGLS
jgi:vacuolar iron transporter family protein